MGRFKLRGLVASLLFCASLPAIGAAATDAGLPVLHVNAYNLDLAFDPVAQTVSGTVTIRLRWSGAVPHALSIDMVQSLRPRSVSLDGLPATFAHDGDTLVVPVPANAPSSQPHLVTILYSGTADPKALQFKTLDGKHYLGSYGLPYSARSWWPDFDDPGLKAQSADMRITVPDDMVAVSNGTLLAVTKLPGGKKLYHWHESMPIYPDVISVAAGPYRETKGTFQSISGREIPLEYYVYPEDQDKAREEFALVPDMMHTFEKLFGAYPFQQEKYGIAEFLIPTFREHQTLPSLGKGLITGAVPVWNFGNVQNVIAHDMAHQWFGDSITVRSWSDIWLNEGMATYAVALWREQHDGEEAYHAFMKSLDDGSFRGPVYIRDGTAVDQLLTSTTFDKGAWVLHMLRHVMGDAKFFAALRNYVEDNRYGLADTRQFIIECEQAYGQPLGWFFEEWLYGRARPVLETKWRAVNDGEIQIDITQTQSGAVFTMPVDVRVDTDAGTVTHTVWLRQIQQTVKIPAAGKVKDVMLDPDGWMLKD